jgi:hypothetical protein
MWRLVNDVNTAKVKTPSYNFVEVSGHNLDSTQTWGFCGDFLNRKEGGMVYYQFFLLSPLHCTLYSNELLELQEVAWIFEEIEISRQVTLNSKEETSKTFAWFRPRIRPQKVLRHLRVYVLYSYIYVYLLSRGFVYSTLFPFTGAYNVNICILTLILSM